MSDLLLIPVCIITGILLVRIKSFPENAHKVINSLIVYVCLPALTLLYIPQIKIGVDVIFPAIIMWIVFLLSVAFFVLLEKIFKWDRKNTGALILTAGLANTSFVGFPVLMALFGEEGLKIGVIIDQVGSFLVLSTFGVIVASVCSSGTYSLKKISLDIIRYPSFIAMIISVILILAGFRHTDITRSVLQKLGSPVIILALISVGMQIKIKFNDNEFKEIFLGLSYKLILAPLAIYLIAVFLQLKGLVFQVSLIESAMPPMVMGSVLAVQFNLNPKLANLMVGIGIPLSFLTLSLWYLLAV